MQFKIKISEGPASTISDLELFSDEYRTFNLELKSGISMGHLYRLPFLER